LIATSVSGLLTTDILKKILMYFGPSDAIHVRRVSCGRMMSSRRDRDPIGKYAVFVQLIMDNHHIPIHESRILNDGKNGVDWLNELNKTIDFKNSEYLIFLFDTR
jgi:hypothetical protein